MRRARPRWRSRQGARFIASVLQLGRTSAAPLPCSGRWRRRYRSRRYADRGRGGRVPRLAQRRVILFFWPMRASSANQISIVSIRRLSRARSPPGGGKFFKILDRARGLGMMARPGRKLAIAHGAQFPAHGLLGDRDAKLLEKPLAKIDQTASAPRHGSAGSAVSRSCGERPGAARPSAATVARRLAIIRPAGPAVEAQHPIADDLKLTPPIWPPRYVTRRRKSPQAPEADAPAGRPSSASPNQAARNRIKILSAWYGAGMTNIPPFAALNQTRAHPESPV